MKNVTQIWGPGDTKTLAQELSGQEVKLTDSALIDIQEQVDMTRLRMVEAGEKVQRGVRAFTESATRAFAPLVEAVGTTPLYAKAAPLHNSAEMEDAFGSFDFDQFTDQRIDIRETAASADARTIDLISHNENTSINESD